MGSYTPPPPPPPPGVNYYKWRSTEEEWAVLQMVPREEWAVVFRQLRSWRFRVRLWWTRRWAWDPLVCRS